MLVEEAALKNLSAIMGTLESPEHRSGVRLDQELPLMPSMLTGAGYHGGAR